MQKKSLLPALIVFLASLAGVYALTTNLFPSTPALPRLPTGDGTIGGVIARIIGTTALDSYLGDGTVRDSRMLSGVTASGYLKPVTCTIVGGVMVGIDADGGALCGPKSKLLVGTWTEGTNATRCPVGTGACGDPLNIGDLLYEGEIIRTNPTNTGTITFTDDLSLLRLDVGTVVELQSGLNTAGQTVAQAILENGQLWGRIVSNTGVNIGGGGVIAGVRGTSLSLTEAGGTFTLRVVDSTRTSGAADIKIINQAVNQTSMPIDRFRYLSYASRVYVNPTELITNVNGSTSTYIQKTRDYLYGDQPWIRENTKKDIEYLYIKKSPDVARTPDIIDRAAAEYAATVDTTDTPALKALCDAGKVFWPSLVGNPLYPDKCQLVGLVAFADYTKSTSLDTHKLYTPKQSFALSGSVLPTSHTLANGYTTAINKALVYDLPPEVQASFSGKTLTLNLAGTATTNGNYFFDGGNMNYRLRTGATLCNGTLSAGNRICGILIPSGTIIDSIGDLYNSNTVNLKLQNNVYQGITPDVFYIGNAKLLTRPIGIGVKSISIE